MSFFTEIDIFKAFSISPNTNGVQKVQGLEKESGDGYKIDKNISRMEQSVHFLEKVQTLLTSERRMVIMANVKVKHYSSGTLFSVEPRSKGVHSVTLSLILRQSEVACTQLPSIPVCCPSF